MQFIGTDFNWDLKESGRMVRISEKIYDNGIYFIFKHFRLGYVSEDGRQRERSIRVGQLTLIIDKVSGFNALGGSFETNDLSEEDRGRRSKFDQMVESLIEERIPSDGLPISFENS